MKNMNKKRWLFVIASLVFSLNNYAAENSFFLSSPVDTTIRQQPLQQSQQSDTSSQSEPVMQTLPATVETVIQEGFVQESTTNSTDSSDTEPAIMEMPVNIGTIVVGVSLAGRVIDPGGLSVADITVKAVQGDETLIAITDNNGNYQFALTQGVWSVFAADLDYDITPTQKVYAVEGYGITRIE